MGCRIYEVGISYYGRTYDEGKKIGWRDGVRAIYAIVKYNLLRSCPKKFVAPELRHEKISKITPEAAESR